MPKPPSLFYRRGVSYAVSVILVTVISISLLAVLFSFGNVYLQSQSRQDKISILSVDVVKLQSSVIVRFSVGNAGTGGLTLTSARLEGAACSKTYSQSIPPGQRFSDTFLCNADLNVGVKLVFRVEATAHDNGALGDAAWTTVKA